MPPRTTAVRFCILLVTGLGLVTHTGCAVSDRKIVDQADQFHGSLEAAVIRDRELAGYLQRVGDRIIEAAREAHRAGEGPPEHFDGEDNQWMFSENMRFHFVNSKTMNAFTTGGEHMYIYTELFQNCKDENDLAAVMAHEYAHIYGRHVQKGTQRQYGVIGLALAGAAGGAVLGGKEKYAEYGALGAGAGAAVGQFFGMGFTRKDEAEADRYGFLFYTNAGWNPDEFADFFQTMIDKGLDTGNAYLSDHPTLKSRVAAAEKAAKDLGPDADKLRRPPVADASTFRSLQRRAAEVGRTMPNDQSLAQTQELLQALPRSCLTPAVRDDQVKAQKSIEKKVEAAERGNAAVSEPAPARRRRATTE